jgi:hypothetical protein
VRAVRAGPKGRGRADGSRGYHGATHRVLNGYSSVLTGVLNGYSQGTAHRKHERRRAEPVRRRADREPARERVVHARARQDGPRDLPAIHTLIIAVIRTLIAVFRNPLSP